MAQKTRQQIGAVSRLFAACCPSWASHDGAQLCRGKRARGHLMSSRSSPVIVVVFVVFVAQQCVKFAFWSRSTQHTSGQHLIYFRFGELIVVVVGGGVVSARSSDFLPENKLSLQCGDDDDDDDFLPPLNSQFNKRAAHNFQHFPRLQVQRRPATKLASPCLHIARPFARSPVARLPVPRRPTSALARSSSLCNREAASATRRPAETRPWRPSSGCFIVFRCCWRRAGRRAAWAHPVRYWEQMLATLARAASERRPSSVARRPSPAPLPINLARINHLADSRDPSAAAAAATILSIEPKAETTDDWRA